MFRYPKINVIIYGGEGARKKCVVHGAFDRSAFGCAVIVLDPALNRNPSPGESKVYASKDLTVGGVLGERCVVHGAFDRSTFGCTVIVLNPALNRNPSSVSPRYMQTRLLTVVECVRVFPWSEALAIQVYYWRTILIYFNATGFDFRAMNR